jgi:3-hexulose-6-phosphate synthase
MEIHGGKPMKLQLALDTLSLSQCLELVDLLKPHLDIIEIGTPVLLEEGLRAVTEMKRRFPHLIVLADAKIMDAGEYEASQCFKAGADIVTVLGVSHNTTISGVVKAAKTYGRKVMVDMIDVHDLKKRAIEIDLLGVDYICVHTAFDLQASGANPLAELEVVKGVLINAKAGVAGGVKLATIDAIAALKPEIVVVGGGITNQSDPLAAARTLKERMSL